MPLLFSYGTLQQDGVQRATFGRLLTGKPDELVGYAQELIKIEDPTVTAKSGRSHHPIVVHTGWQEDRVKGTVFEIDDEDLERADAYEVDAYRRVLAPLASGLRAWVYVDALRGPPEGGSTQ
ncbi:gamma-glutamyl AIG2-like cyclotransferase [Roseiarcus fermentans]|uniref:Gamma-glutamyl AIG2-like cyclotransferase n=1 Tax=Roseiarcus fermentans TaxID=1473586 RepID=A0A366EJK9_9HYPH|nr:gamma-glutamylcyclotransferase family protein [Roseiarcus fermentans]RBP02573.1 gamma-glutamyl AIG2-like cyclotransferase [Roseiarcus fermentans]